ncbi:MAG: hypothetical protein HYZ28_12245 [Myxococcales bacterium]|nr:hypothetical protein [Myxococcales bacterium]
MKKANIVFAALLLPAVALAANSWTINRSSGVAVMGEISTLTFTIANGASSTNSLNKITLKFPFAGGSANDYDIEGGVAPPGWVVQAMDMLNRSITFVPAGGCPAVGLSPGQSDLFGVRVVATPATKDVAGEDLDDSGTGKTEAYDGCANPSVTFPHWTGASSWTRVGLSAQLNVSPRVLSQGGSVTVTMTVTNRASQTKTSITPYQPSTSPPAAQGGATFGLTAGPTPASIASLAQNASAQISWRYVANSDGVSTFSTSAFTTGANAVTSNLAQSQTVSVGDFTGAMSLTPPGVTDGAQVTVSLMVSNNGTSPLTNVVPNPLSISGTATRTLVSGPEPANVATLSAGSAARFYWVYRINGTPGQTYQFSGQATAVKEGMPVASVPVASALGYVVTHTIRANPSSVISGAGVKTIQYTVFNGGGQNIKELGIIDPGAPFGSATNSVDTSGWTVDASKQSPKTFTFTAPNAAAELAPGQSKTFTMQYTIGTVTQTTTYTHRAILTLADGTTVRVEDQVTVFISRTVPDIIDLIALSGPGRNRLIWTNPGDHDGVLVLRSTTGAPSTPPASGTRYTVGDVIGNASVAYVDTLSFSSSFSDTGLTDGQRYYYKVYNHDEFWIYSSGNVPSTQGIFSEPTSRAARTPLWCYNTGFSSSVQPVTETGVGVYSAGNLKAVTSNLTSTDPTLDGSERWRPVRVTGAVQSRSPVVPLAGRSGKWILVGDQSANGYVISATSGAVAWRAGPFVLDGGIQAPPMVQLYQYGNAAFQAAFPGKDLVLFATRRTANRTQNEVRARYSNDGTQAWTFAPGNLDMISGGMLVDYQNNRLWVASRSNGGTQPSLWVVNTLNGGLVTSFNLGDIDHSVNMANQVVIVTTNSGLIYAYDPSTLAQVWSYQLLKADGVTPDATTTYVAPIANGFIASQSSGVVQRYSVDPTTKAVTPFWAWASLPAMTSPAGIRIDYTSQKIYVGDRDGVIHQLSTYTGADENPLTLISGFALGPPAIEAGTSPKRLHVNSEDGRLCAVAVPF